MKKIETMIHTRDWEKTRAILETCHVPATLREVKTFGRTPARHEVYRGTHYVVETTPELELSVCVQDEQLDSILLALSEVTGKSEFLVITVECLVGAANEVGTARRVPAASRPVSALVASGANVLLPAMARG